MAKIRTAAEADAFDLTAGVLSDSQRKAYDEHMPNHVKQQNDHATPGEVSPDGYTGSKRTAAHKCDKCGKSIDFDDITSWQTDDNGYTFCTKCIEDFGWNEEANTLNGFEDDTVMGSKRTADKYDDLASIIESKFGWSVAEQFKAITVGQQPMEDQNDNALRYILNFLKNRQEPEAQDVVGEIQEYFDDNGISTQGSKRTAVATDAPEKFSNEGELIDYFGDPQRSGNTYTVRALMDGQTQFIKYQMQDEGGKQVIVKTSMKRKAYKPGSEVGMTVDYGYDRMTSDGPQGGTSSIWFTPNLSDIDPDLAKHITDALKKAGFTDITDYSADFNYEEAEKRIELFKNQYANEYHTWSKEEQTKKYNELSHSYTMELAQTFLDALSDEVEVEAMSQSNYKLILEEDLDAEDFAGNSDSWYLDPVEKKKEQPSGPQRGDYVTVNYHGQDLDAVLVQKVKGNHWIAKNEDGEFDAILENGRWVEGSLKRTAASYELEFQGKRIPMEMTEGPDPSVGIYGYSFGSMGEKLPLSAYGADGDEQAGIHVDVYAYDEGIMADTELLGTGTVRRIASAKRTAAQRWGKDRNGKAVSYGAKVRVQFTKGAGGNFAYQVNTTGTVEKIDSDGTIHVTYDEMVGEYGYGEHTSDDIELMVPGDPEKSEDDVDAFTEKGTFGSKRVGKLKKKAYEVEHADAGFKVGDRIKYIEDGDEFNGEITAVYEESPGKYSYNVKFDDGDSNVFDEHQLRQASKRIAASPGLAALFEAADKFDMDEIDETRFVELVQTYSNRVPFEVTRVLGSIGMDTTHAWDLRDYLQGLEVEMDDGKPVEADVTAAAQLEVGKTVSYDGVDGWKVKRCLSRFDAVNEFGHDVTDQDGDIDEIFVLEKDGETAAVTKKTWQMFRNGSKKASLQSLSTAGSPVVGHLFKNADVSTIPKNVAIGSKRTAKAPAEAVISLLVTGDNDDYGNMVFNGLDATVDMKNVGSNDEARDIISRALQSVGFTPDTGLWTLKDASNIDVESSQKVKQVANLIVSKIEEVWDLVDMEEGMEGIYINLVLADDMDEFDDRMGSKRVAANILTFDRLTAEFKSYLANIAGVKQADKQAWDMLDTAAKRDLIASYGKTAAIKQLAALDDRIEDQIKMDYGEDFFTYLTGGFPFSDYFDPKDPQIKEIIGFLGRNQELEGAKELRNALIRFESYNDMTASASLKQKAQVTAGETKNDDEVYVTDAGKRINVFDAVVNGPGVTDWKDFLGYLAETKKINKEDLTDGDIKELKRLLRKWSNWDGGDY